MDAREKNEGILHRSRARIDNNENEFAAHRMRLKRWGNGPNLTADTLFWKMLAQSGVDLKRFISEITWARREYGISAIQSPRSWGMSAHQYYCPESLPADFPPLMCYLGQMKNGLLSIRYLGIGTEKYQVRLVATGDATSLYISTKQQLSETQREGLSGALLGVVVENLQDERIITQARMANHQGYPCLRLSLQEDLHEHVIDIAQGQCTAPLKSRETRGWTPAKEKKLERLLDNPQRDQKLRRPFTIIEPWTSTAPGGKKSQYALVREHKQSEIPDQGEVYQSSPTRNAQWDHRHGCWVVDMKTLLENDLEILRRQTAVIEIR